MAIQFGGSGTIEVEWEEEAGCQELITSHYMLNTGKTWFSISLRLAR